jgi:L-aminopeptidase/D-esterase-like protein
MDALLAGADPTRVIAGSATTIGVVATDARLNKAQATQLANLAHHGLSRAISPLTANDGDSLFALATGMVGTPVELSGLGTVAAEVVSRAIRNAVRAARSLQAPDLPAAVDGPGDRHSGG